MCTTNAEKIQAGALRFKYCAATNGAAFDRGHGNRDLEMPVEADYISNFSIRTSQINLLPHGRYAVRAFNVLGRILTGCQKNCSHDV